MCPPTSKVVSRPSAAASASSATTSIVSAPPPSPTSSASSESDKSQDCSSGNGPEKDVRLPKEKVNSAFASIRPGVDDYYWSYTDEPHASRRKEILQKYPQIKELYGHDPDMKYTTLGLIVLQIVMAYYCSRPTTSRLTFFLVAYVIGGTANHMLLLAMHELSHNLGFKLPLHNKLFGLLANTPIGLPSSVSFKRYHMEHHKYQGEDGIDVDIPTVTEGRVFQSSLAKLVFCIFQIFFYALRPMIVNPKKPTVWELMNALVCFIFDVVIVTFMNKWALFYLMLSTFLGSGLHPVAGHFIAEHYVFVKGAETYSYYGILNIFAFNVGYHNEHHDFPFVAGKNLPKLRAIASEYYDRLPQHTSWVKVIYDYIMDPNVTAFSRVKRQRLSNEEVTKMKMQ